MRDSVIGLLLIFAGAVIVAGCERVGEPWDNAGNFKDKPARTIVAQKNLRDRLMHSQNDFEFTTHQTEYR